MYWLGEKTKLENLELAPGLEQTELVLGLGRHKVMIQGRMEPAQVHRIPSMEPAQALRIRCRQSSRMIRRRSRSGERGPWWRSRRRRRRRRLIRRRSSLICWNTNRKSYNCGCECCGKRSQQCFAYGLHALIDPEIYLYLDDKFTLYDTIYRANKKHTNCSRS